MQYSDLASSRCISVFLNFSLALRKKTLLPFCHFELIKEFSQTRVKKRQQKLHTANEYNKGLQILTVWILCVFHHTWVFCRTEDEEKELVIKRWRGREK